MKFYKECYSFNCMNEEDYCHPGPSPIYRGINGPLIGSEDPITHRLDTFDEKLKYTKVDPMGNVCDILGNPIGLSKEPLGQILPTKFGGLSFGSEPYKDPLARFGPDPYNDPCSRFGPDLYNDPLARFGPVMGSVLSYNSF